MAPHGWEYEEENLSYLAQYGQAQPPTKPEYNFESSSGYKVLYVKKILTKLMPIGFDPNTETIIKKLDKKGVKRRKTIMPRIFKLSAFAALSVLIWDFVANINNITIFLVHAFTGK